MQQSPHSKSITSSATQESLAQCIIFECPLLTQSYKHTTCLQECKNWSLALLRKIYRRDIFLGASCEPKNGFCAEKWNILLNFRYDVGLHVTNK